MTTTAPNPIRVVTLAAFIKGMLHGDYSGFPGDTEGEQEANYLDTYSGYCDMLGGARLTALLGTVRTINALASKIQRIETLVSSARCIQDEELTAELKEDGFLVDCDALPEVYNQQLNSALASLAPQKMMLERMRRDTEQPDKTKAEPSDEDFEVNLIELSRFMKYEVTDSVTVYKYCLMVQRLNAHIKAQIKAPQE